MPNTLRLSAPLRVSFGEFLVDEKNALLMHQETPIALAQTPFSLLCAFLRQPGTLLTKQALLDQVWGHRFVCDSVLKGAISDVRKALRDNSRQPIYIQTIPRRGYRFIANPAPCHERMETAEYKSEAQRQTVPRSCVLGEQAGNSPRLAGRIRELARLQQISERVIDGHRAVVMVVGEPGIGKTALIDHFVSARKDMTCIRGQCVNGREPGEPYLPVLEALSELCRKDPDAATLLRTVAPMWLFQMPWLNTSEQRDTLLREAAVVKPQRMLREICEFLDRYTENHPLLLITEDLQWSDPETVSLIDFMARRRAGGRLLWLSSFRLYDGVTGEHPLQALRNELIPRNLCEVIHLDKLSRQEVDEFFAERGKPLFRNEALVHALYERSDGIPLFLSALIRELLRHEETGELPEMLRFVGSVLPEDLGAMADHYLARLTGEQRSVLSAVAVSGMKLSIGTLSRVLGLDPMRVAITCDELARERLWLVVNPAADEGNTLLLTYGFRHALFRQRLSESVGMPVRIELQRKLRAALEAEVAEADGDTDVRTTHAFSIGLASAGLSS